jgi:rhodanese-related sulfurtransferase
MNAAGAVFVDVRNPPELNEGYAPNAVNIPLPELKQRMGELAKDKDLLIYCRSGRRSDAATRILMEQGYDRVYNVLGGYLAYPKK